VTMVVSRRSGAKVAANISALDVGMSMRTMAHAMWETRALVGIRANAKIGKDGALYGSFEFVNGTPYYVFIDNLEDALTSDEIKAFIKRLQNTLKERKTLIRSHRKG